MNKKEAQELQQSLCLNLMDYYASKGYSLDPKEWNIVSNRVILPFYMMSSSGPYITIRPSIIYKEESLLKLINEIIGIPILYNGIFVAGKQIKAIFNKQDILLPHQNKIIEISQMYYWRLFGKADLSWVKEWHIAYMEEVGWNLIKNLQLQECVYGFCRDVFMNYIECKSNKEKLDKFRLDFGSHTTMIYLGLRDQKEEVQKLIDLTIEHFPNTLYSIRANELRIHFNQA